MPRYTSAQLRWSEQAQSYVLFIDDQISTQTFTSEWLEQIASFAFHSRQGMHYTVRKQRVQRGSSYWYAYRRLHGRVVKRYLGKTADLTFAHLEELARLLESTSDSLQHLSVPEQAIPATGQKTIAFDQENEPEQITALPHSALPVPRAGDAGNLAPAGVLPLLISKLSPPRLHAFLLDRSRLFGLLDAGQEYPLTLLSAPAGFGKTTLVCQWMATRHARPDFPLVAWLSLEAADNDPLRFWRYLIAACQMFQVDLQAVHTVLRASVPQPPFLPSSLETVLTTLLNALAQSPVQGMLILEDYHVITSPEIQETFAFFLEHLPPTLHLILITRSDPPFSLARLRTQNGLYEVRTSDLRFSQAETAILLHHALPFPLEASTIQRLHEQLQGWGVGLHLIKLALQKTTTLAEEERVLALFSRNNASLQEYFVNEVLALQSEAVQQFVLQTCLFTRLTVSLCDAVTAQHNGQEMLALLERVNLFLEPLDASALDLPPSSPQWYRYHALFAEAMRAEARHRFDEDHLHQLSARASHWYEMHGFLSEAIEAALSTQDYEQAALLLARSIEEQTFPGEMYEPHTLHCWFAQFPETILEKRPLLCLSYATTLLWQSASWQPNAPTLPLLDQLLRMAEDGFCEENNLPKLGELFAFRALLALRKEQPQVAISAAEQALAWLPQTQRLWRGLCLSIMGEKWIQMGHLPQARAALFEAQALCEAAQNPFFKHVALIKLAQVCFEQGESQQAASLFRQTLVGMRAQEQTKSVAHWHCVALLDLAALCYESNELASVYQYAQEAIVVSQSHHLIYHEIHATLALARVQQAQGQMLVAQQCLTDLFERIPVSLPQFSQEIQAAQTRVALALGDQITVQRWATAHTSHPDLAQQSEEALLFNRWLRAQGKLEEAARQLECLLDAAHTMGHSRRALEIQVEMVLVEAAKKRKPEALHLLREVLTQAFTRNAQRLFLDAGEPMAILLRSLLPQVQDQPLLAYIRALLKAFPIHPQNGKQAQSAALLEPLSSQETRVLHLLAQHRSNADIANELVVSVNTVRTQVQSIYSKLGVHSRGAASEVARELQLL